MPRPTVRVDPDFGPHLRELRMERGLSYRKFAELVHYSHPYLIELEHGTRKPSKELASHLDTKLHANGTLARLVTEPGETPSPPPADPTQLVAGNWRREDAETLASQLIAEPPTASDAVRLVLNWLVTEPPQIYELRAGRRIGLGTVATVEKRAHQLRLLDDHVAGGDTRKVVAEELDATMKLLREASYTDQVGKRLLRALAELCQLAGWVSSDAGRYAEARRIFLVGVRAGHAAGDWPGAANNLSSLAYQVANVGDPREAMTLAAAAYRGSEGTASATTRALLLERLAWTSARAAEPGQADRALGRVDEAYAQRRPEDDPAWVYWLDADEIAIMAGRCWTQLRRPLRAVPVLEEATKHYTADRARETALYLTWLSEAYLLANEVDASANTALRALRLSRQANSVRTRERVGALFGLLLPHHGNVAVDEFLDECRAAGISLVSATA